MALPAHLCWGPSLLNAFLHSRTKKPSSSTTCGFSSGQETHLQAMFSGSQTLGCWIRVQVVDWGGFLGSTPMGKWRGQNWAKEEAEMRCTHSKASADFTGDWVTYCWPWLPQEGVTTLKRQLSLSRRGSPLRVISRPHSKQGVGVGERLCPRGGEWGPDQPGSVHHRIPKPDRSRSQRSWMCASAEKTASMEWEEAPAKSELKKLWKRITGTQRRYREMKTAS